MALDPQTAWDAFAPFEVGTIIPAGLLVDRAGIHSGERVLDVGCGTGVVAVTAARRGAKVSAIDPSKALLERGRDHCQTAEVEVEWAVAGAEKLPFESETFDVVLSQFAHIFAPDPERALAEIARVLKPGGRFVFNAWAADSYPGTLFALVARYGLKGGEVPSTWGDAEILMARLAIAFEDIHISREVLHTPCLSPAHVLRSMERGIWPVTLLVEQLRSDPDALKAFRGELTGLVIDAAVNNTLAQPYITVTAVKR